ncbi:MAG: mechanosensitive ion channel [Proteobacteria bacterium]|nr:mechanosensitive ion channel [Pseudomonadota bacterium]
MKTISISVPLDKKRNFPICSVAFVLFLVLGVFLLPGFAQNIQKDVDQTVEKELSIETIESIDKTLQSLNTTLDKITNTPIDKLASELGLTSDQIRKKITGLNDLNSAYVSLKNALLGLEKVKKEQQTIQQSDDLYRTEGMIKKPPYSLTFHDSIQAEISVLTKNKKNIELTLGILKTNIEDYKNQLSEKEKEIRQLKEELNGTPEQKNVQNAFELELKEVSVQHLQLMIRALGIETNRYNIENNNAVIKLKLLKEQEAFVVSNITRDKEDLNHQLELIQTKEINIKNEISKFRNGQKLIEQELDKAQQNLNKATLEQERNIAQTILKAREEWRKTYIVVVELKQDALVLLNRQKTIWQQRYAIVKGELPQSQEKQIKDETEKNITSLNQTLQMQQNYLVNLQKQISAIEGLIQEEGVSASIKNNFFIEMDALRKQFERRLEFQSMIVATDQIERNLLAQIEKKIDQPSVNDHLSGFRQTVKSLWNMEIWVVDQKSVSVGKVFFALFILATGIIFSRFFLHHIHKRILATSQFKETTASAVHKALSYFAYLLVFLFALRIVNIPLTAFAFLGGAIAIGVGFGAQNLINNFISGFIILGERPIHIGDLIEVEGVLGKVEEIGARCTRVRTGENVHKLVPNSSFLEKNITNWTLSDNRIRTKVVVGLSYGSPVRTVEEALLKAAKSNPNVLENPEPFVLFSDFGDNSLVFELYFWVVIRMVLEKKQIESQVRFEIDALFRQEGLVIAFPQRDIHFDNTTPLSIQMIQEKIDPHVR